MSKTEGVVVRITCAVEVDTVRYSPNQLVKFEKKEADRLVKSDSADDHEDSIAYCKNVLKEEVIEHGVEPKAAEQVTAE